MPQNKTLKLRPITSGTVLFLAARSSARVGRLLDIIGFEVALQSIEHVATADFEVFKKSEISTAGVVILVVARDDTLHRNPKRQRGRALRKTLNSDVVRRGPSGALRIRWVTNPRLTPWAITFRPYRG